jgi:hypothetical protein
VTQIRILGRANSLRKVLWTCDELGIAYTREDWGRGFRPTSQPEFLRSIRWSHNDSADTAIHHRREQLRMLSP